MALANTEAGCQVPQQREQTVEEVLTERIEYSRKEVERLCIAKAKAETLGLLKYPYQEMCKILAIF